MVASDRLQRLSETLHLFGRYASEEVLECIDFHDADLGKAIRQVVEQLPRALNAVVVDAVVAAAAQYPTSAAARAIARWSERYSFDVRSYREAAQSLRKITEALQKERLVDRQAGAKLDHLEQVGVLGHQTTEQLMRFVRAIYHRLEFAEDERIPSPVMSTGHSARAGDEVLDRDQVFSLAQSLATHDPTWGQRAGNDKGPV